MAAIAFVCLWAAYGFRFAATPDPAFEATIPWDRLRPDEPALARAVDAMREAHLLPEAYLWGFVRFFKHQQGRPAFLLGAHSDDGFWNFFPVSFAVKTPVALLVLLGARGVAGRVATPAQPGRRLPLGPRGPVRRRVAEPRHQHRPSPPAAAVPVPVRRRRPRGGVGGRVLAAARPGRGGRAARRVARRGRALDPSPLPRVLQRAGGRPRARATGSSWTRAWTGDRTCAG